MNKKNCLFVVMMIMTFSIMSFVVPDSFAYLVQKTPLEQYQENEVILIGNVISLKENPSEGFTEYEINVEKFMKNPQTSKTLFVIGSGAQSSEIQLSIDKIFSVNDRVFLFLNEQEGKYQISPYSFNALIFSPDDEFLLPPLTLFRAGIPSDEIVCRDHLELVLKIGDNSPACVKPSTKEKLIERGWTIG
ncbi:MAG: hypothetical protein OEL81_08370 [Nitrosopumilus sp.]|nr:hypothetical protein [Nitrosopumilus sp.]